MISLPGEQSELTDFDGTLRFCAHIKRWERAYDFLILLTFLLIFSDNLNSNFIQLIQFFFIWMMKQKMCSCRRIFSLLATQKFCLFSQSFNVSNERYFQGPSNSHILFDVLMLLELAILQNI